MKAFLSLSFFLLVSFSLSSQSETRDLDSFTGVDVSAGISVTYHTGSPKAEITYKNADADDLILKQMGKTLKINYKSSWNWNSNKNRSIKIKLYGDQPLNSVDVSSGAYFYADDSFSTDSFDASASSGGSLSVDIEADEVEVDVNSGGSAEIAGKTGYLEVDANSGGSFKGLELRATKVDAEANSGGSAKVWATDHISAGSNSGGSIKYKGDPKTTDIDRDKWSGGSVKKI